MASVLSTDSGATHCYYSASNLVFRVSVEESDVNIELLPEIGRGGMTAVERYLQD